jgi:hypothetical protein
LPATTLRKFAKQIGVKIQLWNNAEMGVAVSKKLEDILVEKIPGLTIDWIRRGRFEGISEQLVRKLGANGQDQKWLHPLSDLRSRDQQTTKNLTPKDIARILSELDQTKELSLRDVARILSKRSRD